LRRAAVLHRKRMRFENNLAGARRVFKRIVDKIDEQLL
jgi:hypothetical protein